MMTSFVVWVVGHIDNSVLMVQCRSRLFHMPLWIACYVIKKPVIAGMDRMYLWAKCTVHSKYVHDLCHEHIGTHFGAVIQNPSATLWDFLLQWPMGKCGTTAQHISIQRHVFCSFRKNASNKKKKHIQKSKSNTPRGLCCNEKAFSRKQKRICLQQACCKYTSSSPPVDLNRISRLRKMNEWLYCIMGFNLLLLCHA